METMHLTRYSYDMECCVNGLHAPNDGNKSSFSMFIIYEELDSSSKTITIDHSICTICG